LETNNLALKEASDLLYLVNVAIGGFSQDLVEVSVEARCIAEELRDPLGGMRLSLEV
jgi:hypothetical protein